MPLVTINVSLHILIARICRVVEALQEAKPRPLSSESHMLPLHHRDRLSHLVTSYPLGIRFSIYQEEVERVVVSHFSIETTCQLMSRKNIILHILWCDRSSLIKWQRLRLTDWLISTIHLSLANMTSQPHRCVKVNCCFTENISQWISLNCFVN